jgi:hypothetical protein
LKSPTPIPTLEDALGSGASLTNAAGATLQGELDANIYGSGSLLNEAGATLRMVPTTAYDYVNINVPRNIPGETVNEEGR